MTRAAERDHLELVIKVARAYYLQELSQAQIAAELNFSRPTISRLLAEARRRGVVRFHVEHPLERVMEVEAAIAERYGIERVRVAAAASGVSDLWSVARTAADVVAEYLASDSLIAMSNGLTLAALVEALQPARHPDVCVVQMIGSLGPANTMLDAPDLCRRAAARLGGSYRAMPVPLVVRTAQLARAMRQEQAVATALQLASRADIALVGIGRCDEESSGRIFEGWMTPRLAAETARAGAVGHLLGHHFDATGRHLRTDLCDRTIAVSLDALRNIPLVIGVASGIAKARAVAGALRGQHLDVLVLDEPLARRLA